MSKWLEKLSNAEAEKPPAVVHDLDRYAAEKEAATRCWRFRFNDTEVDVASGATLAEAHELLRIGPDDLLELVIEYDDGNAPVSLSAPSMPGWQETTIRMWLSHIGETDLEIIAETINKCHVDIEAREFFLGCARNALSETDQAVTCGDCEHFQPDTIGDGSGIGSCEADAWKSGRGPCLYPKAKRFCNDFKQEQINERCRNCKVA